MRRWGISHWLSLIFALVAFTAAIFWMALWGFVGPDAKDLANGALDMVLAAGLTRSDILYAAGKIAGVTGTAVSGSLALLRLWHFAERNLPARLQEFIERFNRDHLPQRQEFVRMATAGQLHIPKPIDASDTVYLRELLARWTNSSPKNNAELTAASADRYGKLASMLGKAADGARQRQITAHVLRGYDLEKRDRGEEALAEFQKAMAVDRTDLYSRDVAAGCARRLKKTAQEEEILEELSATACSAGDRLMQAIALRRQAEIHLPRSSEQDLLQVSNRLKRDAIPLLPLDSLNLEERHEAGRLRAVLCKVQYRRGVLGRLIGTNQPAGQMLSLMSGLPDQYRPAERGGEVYGQDCSERIYHQLVSARSDPDTRAPDDGD